jgi:hypothetical protein
MRRGQTVFPIKKEEDEFQFIRHFSVSENGVEIVKGQINILKNFNYVIIIPVDFHEKNIRFRLLNVFLFSEKNYKN